MTQETDAQELARLQEREQRRAWIEGRITDLFAAEDDALRAARAQGVILGGEEIGDPPLDPCATLLARLQPCQLLRISLLRHTVYRSYQ